MVNLSNYSVVAGGSSDAYKYHRNLLEQVLRENSLSDPARAELRHQLQLTIESEFVARQHEEDEVERKKKERTEGETTGRGEGAGAASGGAGLVSRDNGIVYEENAEPDDASIDPLVLLLLMAETDCTARHVEPMPAAVVLDPQDKIAHLYKTEVEHDDHGHQLQALEHRAARAGALAFQLKVAPDAVDLFKQKFGYEPVGAQFNRAGKPMQRMRKTFNRAPLLTPQPQQ
jgi:hypothetical protein